MRENNQCGDTMVKRANAHSRETAFRIAIVMVTLGIAALLNGAGLVSSNGEGFRMIKQGAVKIDGEKISDKNLKLSSGFQGVVQVGKRKFARVKLS